MRAERMTQPIESITELFDRAAQMAAERLAETLGHAVAAELIADTETTVNVGFDLKRRNVAVTVRCLKRYGEKTQIPVMFKLPPREAN
jgi:hypothetical protein